MLDNFKSWAIPFTVPEWDPMRDSDNKFKYKVFKFETSKFIKKGKFFKAGKLSNRLKRAYNGNGKDKRGGKKRNKWKPRPRDRSRTRSRSKSHLRSKSRGRSQSRGRGWKCRSRGKGGKKHRGRVRVEPPRDYGDDREASCNSHRARPEAPGELWGRPWHPSRWPAGGDGGAARIDRPLDDIIADDKAKRKRRREAADAGDSQEEDMTTWNIADGLWKLRLISVAYTITLAIAIAIGLAAMQEFPVAEGHPAQNWT
eukprot:gene12243-661_t